MPRDGAGRWMRKGTRWAARAWITLLILAAGPAPGARAGSIYSVGGLGEPSLEEGARLRALGGAGAAEHGERLFSLVNPASVAEVNHLIIEGTILPSLRRVDAGSFPSETARETSIPSLRALILLPGRVVLGGAYLVGTNARFQIDRPESAGTASDLHIEGSGGIDLIRVTLARRLSPSLNLGLDYEVIAGSFREDWTRDFADTTFETTRDTLETSYARHGRWRIGGQVHRGGWSLGGVYETARRLPLTYTQRTAGGFSQREHESIRIPSGYAVGVSGALGSRMRLVGQYRRANWNRESLASELVSFRASERYSFGVERFGAAEGGLAARLPLRLGVSYLRWPELLPLAGATDIGGGVKGVDEWMVALGTGFRSQDRGGAVDLALEGGSRGDRDALGVSERFLRFAVTLQVSDDTWK